ncbi:hypothetical protein AB0P17_27270 [Streptomyces sp. NPDC088124]|uniref:hypothetical protein n=1 Tax=Streptomyces sp. NPDC088124 TaxID=3154654 RepID=UPI003437A2D0
MVAEKTKGVGLKELFSIDGEASLEAAEATARLESLRSGAPKRARAARGSRHGLCSKLLSDDS